jgi:hypothetical protein
MKRGAKPAAVHGRAAAGGDGQLATVVVDPVQQAWHLAAA